MFTPESITLCRTWVWNAALRLAKSRYERSQADYDDKSSYVNRSKYKISFDSLLKIRKVSRSRNEVNRNNNKGCLVKISVSNKAAIGCLVEIVSNEYKTTVFYTYFWCKYCTYCIVITNVSVFEPETDSTAKQTHWINLPRVKRPNMGGFEKMHRLWMIMVAWRLYL